MFSEIPAFDLSFVELPSRNFFDASSGYYMDCVPIRFYELQKILEPYLPEIIFHVKEKHDPP